MVGDTGEPLSWGLKALAAQPSAQAGLVFLGEFSGAPNP
ncbi:hypothetical protein UFOVP143_13 [uncultured Caudovirales phage]|uniref:Uncharacterized protein n=1 Tax=uncultured Caudovirales phage TaxID=2100421 RepID=A0A6J7VKT0_9CAUD|nr:hypothetical protein UFOVP143_13 [uncultured Caudovirales phage]